MDQALFGHSGMMYKNQFNKFKFLTNFFHLLFISTSENAFLICTELLFRWPNSYKNKKKNKNNITKQTHNQKIKKNRSEPNKKNCIDQKQNLSFEQKKVINVHPVKIHTHNTQPNK